jgi:hypothetical protein
MADEERGTVILADIYDPHIADVERYLEEVRVLDDALRKASKPLRDLLVKDGVIRRHADVGDGLALASVDSSSVEVSSGEVCTVIALAVRYHEESRIIHASARKTGPNNEGFRHMGNALRLRVETELLARSEGITVADHSFWSLLMEANKAITNYENLSADQGKIDLADIHDACFVTGKLFMKAMRNENVIAMSKISSTMALTSKQSPYSMFFNGVRISDRAIYSAILEEGEYTKPRRIDDATEGSFGIEDRTFEKEEREELRFMFTDWSGLLVFYYRPWAFQPAYRIEFHAERFASAEAMAELMDTIRRETSNRLMREPVPQFVADRICQQVHSIAMLYGEAHRIRFPHLLFPNRSSEI